MDDTTMDAEDALEFIDGLRLMLQKKPGFRWLDAKLESLRRWAEDLACEEQRLRSFVHERGLMPEYERWRAHGYKDC